MNIHVGPISGGGAIPDPNQGDKFTPPPGVMESMVTLQQELQKFAGDINANKPIDQDDLQNLQNYLSSSSQQLQMQLQVMITKMQEHLPLPPAASVDKFLNSFNAVFLQMNYFQSRVDEALTGLGQAGMATQLPLLLKQIDEFLTENYPTA